MDVIKKLAQLEKEAADFGFKWETPEQILEQIKSEIKEIDVHLLDHDRAKLQDEIGDLLHAAFSLCVFCKFNPEETLTQSVNKFSQRFEMVKMLAKKDGLQSLNGKSFADLMSYWDKAKQLASSKYVK